MSKRTLHELVELLSELFEDADRPGVICPVADVSPFDVGTVIQQNATDPLITRVDTHSQCILEEKININRLKTFETT